MRMSSSWSERLRIGRVGIAPMAAIRAGRVAGAPVAAPALAAVGPSAAAAEPAFSASWAETSARLAAHVRHASANRQIRVEALREERPIPRPSDFPVRELRTAHSVTGTCIGRLGLLEENSGAFAGFVLGLMAQASLQPSSGAAS